MASPYNITRIPAPRVPFLDERTGQISREWYRFLLNLFVLTGSGTNPTTLDELQLGPPPLTIDEINVIIANNAGDLAPQYQDMSGLYADLYSQAQLASMPSLQLGTMAPINIDNVPYLGFDTAPSWIGSNAGQFWYDSTTGSFNAKMGNNNITQQIGEEFFVYGKASSAISDTNLQLVYKTGVVGASGVIKFAPAVAGITDPDQIIGIATESIATNGFGRVTTAGTVHGINTTGSVYGETWADNDDIWYNPVTGGLTKTKPSAPNIKLQVGTVINASGGGSGSFNVKFGSSSALGGTDSNVQFGTLATNDLIQYNGTYWTNVAPSSISIGTATNLAGGAANRISYQTAPSTTGFIVAPTVANTYLEWSGTAFQWSANPLGTVTSVAALTIGTTGTDLSSTVANPTTTPVITLNVPTASATNRGALSAADWTTFNSKADAFTYTSTYIPYGQGTTTPAQSSDLTFNSTSKVLTVTGGIGGGNF